MTTGRRRPHKIHHGPHHHGDGQLHHHHGDGRFRHSHPELEGGGHDVPRDEHPEMREHPDERDYRDDDRGQAQPAARRDVEGRADVDVRGRRRPVVVTSPEHGELVSAVRDLAARVAGLAPNVLSTSTVLLDANGTATKSYRVPFAAVAITSASANQLTIMQGSGIGTAAPGPSDGAGQIPPLGFAAHNISGYSWTLVGGNPGEQVTVSTFGRLVPPVSESGLISGTVTAVPQGSASNANTGVSGTAPVVGTNIVQSGQLGQNGLFQIDWILMIQGTAAAGDANNMNLLLGATVLTAGLIPAVVNTPVTQLRIFARNSGGTGVQAKVQAIANATAAAVYVAQISATRVA